MAVSGLKARMVMFETGDSTGGGGGTLEPNDKSVPPVLQKLRQNQLQQQAESNGSAKSGSSSITSNRSNSQSSLKSTIANGNAKPAVDKQDETDTSTVSNSNKTVPGKLNIANTFLTGAAPPPLKPVVTAKKPVLTSANSETSGSSPESNTSRPKVALKPPQASKPNALASASGLQKHPHKSPAVSQESKPNVANKPTSPTWQQSNTNSNTAISTFSGPVKLPSLSDRAPTHKTNSSSSTASSSSASTTASSPTSPSSSVQNDAPKGPIDFRSQLRKTSAAGVTNSTPGRRISIDVAGSKDLSTPKVVPNNTNASLSNEADAKTTHTTDTPKLSTVDTSVVERQSDRKRFKKIHLSSLPPASQSAPQKPQLPSEGVDLSIICRQYESLINGLEFEDDEDVYTDGTSDVVLTRSPSQSTSHSTVDNRVSMIPTMSAEEEGIEEEDFYDDGTSAAPEGDLLYVDASSEVGTSSVHAIEEDDVYEDEASVMEETEEAKKKRLKEEAEVKKREEKRQKEEEKRKKQEEKEEKRRKKVFNLTGNETSVGLGEIKKSIKGNKGKNTLSLDVGQKVTIIRMNDNPANMWLVKTDTDMGYVESSNIEIDPNIIRQAMESQRNTSANSRVEDGDDQPMYDDVAAESPRVVQQDEDGEMEEIYECVQ